MRVLLLFLFSAITVFAGDPQAAAPAAQGPENLTIPAQLSKAIDTNKCKAGDAVEMRTLEPVLVGNGLVMPENAKLHGKIVGAASRQNDQPSWVLLVVERAEWKQHSVALHAFIASQITIKAKVPGQSDNAFQNAIDMPDRVLWRRGARQLPQSYPGGDLSRTLTHPPRDATIEGNDARQLSYHGVDDLRLLQAKNGSVFLVSPKPHLKLPSGTMFMLRNQAAATQVQTAATKPAGSGQ